MEGVDVVRQAADEAALDLDQQAMQELVRELPDYEIRQKCSRKETHP